MATTITPALIRELVHALGDALEVYLTDLDTRVTDLDARVGDLDEHVLDLDARIATLEAGTTPEPPPIEYRDPRYFPFHPESIWNFPIGDGATYEDAVKGTGTWEVHQLGAVINRERWSVAVGIASSTDPVRRVTCDNDPTLIWDIHIPDLIPNWAGDMVAFAPTGGTDGWTTVISPEGTVGYEFYAAKKWPDGHWSTRYPLIITDLYGNGARSGRRAGNTSQLGGLIRDADLKAGRIDHALGMGIASQCLKKTPEPNATDGDNIGKNSTGGGWVFPANGADNQANSAYTGHCPMGAVLAIPATVDLSTLGLSAEGLWLGRALQTQGAIVMATSATASLMAEPICEPAAIDRMNRDWGILMPMLRRLTNSIGGKLDPDRQPEDVTVVLGGGERLTPNVPDLAPAAA